MPDKFELSQNIAEEIRKYNTKERDRFPSSDSFIKDLIEKYSLEYIDIIEILDHLKNSHFVFIINIVSPGSDDSIFFGIDTYVYAEYPIIEELKNLNEKNLEKTYEATYYQKKPAKQIVREVFPKVKELNNTPLGKTLNLSVMLEECSRIMKASAFEFTNEWRLDKLKSLCEGVPQEEQSGKIPTVDLENEIKIKKNFQENKNIIEKGTPWARLTSKFSIPFIINIHLKKYEFLTIRKLVQKGKITEIPDLMYIKNKLLEMIRESKNKYYLDSFKNDIEDLKKILDLKVQIIKSKSKKAPISLEDPIE